MTRGKYWTFFKNYLSTGFEYRGAFAIWILSEIIGIAAGLFVWLAVFRTRSEVGGYSMVGMVSYFMLTPFVGTITKTFVSDRLPKRIKDGEISRDLLRPYSLPAVLFIEHLGVKSVGFFLKLPVLAALVYFLLSFLGYPLNLKNLLLGILVALFGFLLRFFMDLALSFSSFWVEGVWSLSHLMRVSFLIFGGTHFPLDIIPPDLRPIFEWLPFKFAYFFPTKVILGGLSSGEIVFNLGQLLLWLVIFFVLSKILLRLGIRKYGAYGG